MIFGITRSSTIAMDEPEKPIEEAKKIEGKKGWFIELESLEELEILHDKHGALELTISFSHNYKELIILDHRYK